MSDSAVLIFAKTPRPGEVKTRLIPALGETGAMQLYTGLLRRELDWIGNLACHAIELWVTPLAEDPLLQQLAVRHGASLHLQEGADLGERMGHAVQTALERYARVVVLGVDCPALNPTHLQLTFEWLKGDEDAVLGPAVDGGYVLLGLNRYHPDLFQGHAWGGDDVAATTRQALRRIGWRWRELPLLWDLDRPDDLLQLRLLGIELPGL